MDKEQFRGEFSQAFYRSLEEGGIEISALPAAQLQALTRACSDAVFATLDRLDRPKPPDSEEVLWTGKPFMRLGENYELTNQRLRIYKGVFSRSLHEVDLVHVREATFTQNLGERMWSLGDVTLVTTNPEHPEIVLENVKDPEKVRETIRSAYLAEQKRRGVRYREDA
ncbi:PH domain-containing protein [bacterium]|nr:PH domain-containing protein [bacterium]